MAGKDFIDVMPYCPHGALSSTCGQCEDAKAIAELLGKEVQVLKAENERLAGLLKLYISPCESARLQSKLCGEVQVLKAENERLRECPRGRKACDAEIDDLRYVKEFEHVINSNSLENDSDTPDFILARFITDCLLAFTKACNRRESWYGAESDDEPLPPSPATQTNLTATLYRDNDDEPVLPAPGPTARIVDHDAFVHGQIEARNVALEFCADIADQHASGDGIAQTIAAEIRAAKTNSASAATTLAEPADDDEPVLPAPGKVVAHLTVRKAADVYLDDAGQSGILTAEEFRDRVLEEAVHVEESRAIIELRVREIARVRAENERFHRELSETREILDKTKNRIAQLRAENAELRAFITHQGFQRCDVPTCNCGSYHGGHAFARFHEIGEALVEAGARSNGSTVLTDVKRVLTENVELVAALKITVPCAENRSCSGCPHENGSECKTSTADLCKARALLTRLAAKESKT